MAYDNSPWSGKLTAGNHFICSCGESSNKPFCDGNHSGSGKTPTKLEVSEEKSVALCMCGKTTNGPLCDGSHRNP